MLLREIHTGDEFRVRWDRTLQGWPEFAFEPLAERVRELVYDPDDPEPYGEKRWVRAGDMVPMSDLTEGVIVIDASRLTDWDVECSILRKARALVLEGWCKHDMARDEADRQVPYESASAVRFCLLGGIKRASQDLHNCADWRTDLLISKVACLAGGLDPESQVLPMLVAPGRLIQWNDVFHRTQQEVADLLGRALKHRVAHIRAEGA